MTLFTLPNTATFGGFKRSSLYLIICIQLLAHFFDCCIVFKRIFYHFLREIIPSLFDVKYLGASFAQGTRVLFTCSASAGQCLLRVVVVVVVVVLVGKKFKIGS